MLKKKHLICVIFDLAFIQIFKKQQSIPSTKPSPQPSTLPLSPPPPHPPNPSSTLPPTMSSNRPTSTSMASVWDTLNRMKERQAKAQSTAPRPHTTHRKDAIILFEREISAAVNNAETDGRVVLTRMREKMDADQHVRAIIDANRERIQGNTDAEMKSLKKAIHDVRQELTVASAALKRANDLAYRLKLQLGS